MSAERMKHFPLTDDIVEELDDLRAACWGHINGRKLTDEKIGELAHVLSEIGRFNKFGREDACPAGFYFGPGHHSRHDCERKLGHDPPHSCVIRVNEVAQWNGLCGSTDFFDEVREIDGPA
jgi:hypothetical protein